MPTAGQRYLVAGRGVVIPTVLVEKERCVVCGIKGVPFEEHHTVPRHLGGNESPLVNLCGGCHQLVHNTATAILANRPTEIPHNPTVKMSVLKYLVNVVVNAALRASGETGKNWTYSRTFSDQQHTKLVRLAKHYGSQDKAIDLALDMLYQSTFRG